MRNDESEEWVLKELGHIGLAIFTKALDPHLKRVGKPAVELFYFLLLNFSFLGR